MQNNGTSSSATEKSCGTGQCGGQGGCGTKSRWCKWRCYVGIFVVVLGAFLAGHFLSKSEAPTRASLTAADLEQPVTELLTQKPDILLKAFEALRTQRDQQTSDAQQRYLGEFKQFLASSPDVISTGNPKGDVTIVEFFDYQCGYCRKVFPNLMEVVEADGNIRLVFKELPILSEASDLASHAALAMNKQGKYVAYHRLLMQHSGGPLDEATLEQYAKALGADLEKFNADRKSAEVQAIIDRNKEFANKLQISGTPAFFIGDQFIPGSVSTERLKELVAQARKKS